MVLPALPGAAAAPRQAREAAAAARKHQPVRCSRLGPPGGGGGPLPVRRRGQADGEDRDARVVTLAIGRLPALLGAAAAGLRRAARDARLGAAGPAARAMELLEARSAPSTAPRRSAASRSISRGLLVLPLDEPDVLPQPRPASASRGPGQAPSPPARDRCQAAPTTAASRSKRPGLPGRPFRLAVPERQGSPRAPPITARCRPTSRCWKARERRRTTSTPSCTATRTRRRRDPGPAGLYYNEYFPGHMIAMPQPLPMAQVTTPTAPRRPSAQEANDVT